MRFGLSFSMLNSWPVLLSLPFLISLQPMTRTILDVTLRTVNKDTSSLIPLCTNFKFGLPLSQLDMRTCIVTLRPIPTIKGNCNVTVWLGYTSKPVVVRTFFTPIFKWFRQFRRNRSGCYYLDCCIGTLGQGWK